MEIEIISKSIASAGLICDVVGAWLVAWEVTNQFKDKKSHTRGGIASRNNLGYNMVDEQPLVISKQTTEDTPAFSLWELKKHKKMKIGIWILTIGFVMQIISLWVYSRPAKTKHAAKEIHPAIIIENPNINKPMLSIAPPTVPATPPTIKPKPAK